MLTCGASAAHAQYLDARLIPRGVLRFDFSPRYSNYDRRFAMGNPFVSDGDPEPLGTDLTASAVGSNLFPTLGPAEEAIRSLTNNDAYGMNVGAFETIRDADIRHFPFGFAFGLFERVTLRVNLPIVTTRSQVTFTSDSTDANVGWNLANENYGDATTAAQAAALVSEISAAVAEVEALIAGGSFGCPTSTTCDQARASVSRAMALLDNLMALTGIGAGDVVPFAPLATSAAGAAILAEIGTVASELAALGAAPVTTTLPLPLSKLSAADINDRLLGGPDFDASPIDFNRQTKLGDIEVGARFGLLTGSAVRAVLATTVRLPTGRPSSADNFVDIGTGDGQTDLEVGLEAALEPGGSVGISFGASYTLQMPHNLTRRITTPDAPLVPISRRVLVQRDLGDVLTVSAYPTIRLSDVFRVFGSVHYYRKAKDDFSLAGSPNGALPDVALLAVETEQRALSFGGGIAYRSDRTSTGRALPIEAGLNYRSAFSGSGGLTPKANTMQLYLRLFFRINGERGAGSGEQ
jgi:hypothetical protein